MSENIEIQKAYDYRNDPVFIALDSFTDAQAKELCKKLDGLSSGYFQQIKQANDQTYLKVGIEEKKRKGSDVTPIDQLLFYHTLMHAIEMYYDAGNIATNARKLMPDVSDEKMQLYVKLVQSMHAVHDIVQGIKRENEPDANERDSYKVFAKDLLRVLGEVKMENEGTANSLLKMAEKVIVDGTKFEFAEKSSRGVIKILDPKNRDNSSGLTDLAMVTTSIDDTSRMVNLPVMLKDPVAREALKKQFNSLKNNIIVKALLESMKITLPVETSKLSQPLYNNTKSKSAHDFDGLQDEQLIQILSFMQQMGQNLRMIREMRPADSKLQTLFHDAVMLGKTTNVERGSAEQANEEFVYIQGQLEKEVDGGGFSADMGAKERLSEINAILLSMYGVDNAFPVANQKTWAEYVQNASVALKSIRESNYSKSDITDAFAQLAHNQTGRFMPAIKVRYVSKSVNVRRLTDTWQEKIDKDPTFIPRPSFSSKNKPRRTS